MTLVHECQVSSLVRLFLLVVFFFSLLLLLLPLGVYVGWGSIAAALGGRLMKWVLKMTFL